ncbi:hypothetical protein RA268_28205, partial [Pseudomonas syringae pv. tagetis]
LLGGFGVGGGWVCWVWVGGWVGLGFGCGGVGGFLVLVWFGGFVGGFWVGCWGCGCVCVFLCLFGVLVLWLVVVVGDGVV